MSPQSRVESARQAVVKAREAVESLAPGYPPSFDVTLSWLEGAVEAAEERLEEGSAPVERLASEIEDTARTLEGATKAASSRMRRIGT